MKVDADVDVKTAKAVATTKKEDATTKKDVTTNIITSTVRDVDADTAINIE